MDSASELGKLEPYFVVGLSVKKRITVQIYGIGTKQITILRPQMPILEEHQASDRVRLEGYTANKLSQALIYSVCNRKRRLSKTALIEIGARRENDIY